MKTRKNYIGDKVPYYGDLSVSITKALKEVEKLERYKFTELFVKNPRGYYEKNIEVFKSIGYNSKTKESVTVNNEIQGLYIFYKNGKAIYTGISRKLTSRLRQHFLGKSHLHASLVYLIARDEYDKKNDDWTGIRAELPGFAINRKRFQTDMINNWKISIYPEEDNYKLYMLELAVATKFQTKWNSFKTH